MARMGDLRARHRRAPNAVDGADPPALNRAPRVVSPPRPAPRRRQPRRTGMDAEASRLGELRAAIRAACRRPEAECLPPLLDAAAPSPTEAPPP
ncbi:MAG: hypothetical protein ACO3EK_15275, partial [Alphaproteobacteria bacterium]